MEKKLKCGTLGTRQVYLQVPKALVRQGLRTLTWPEGFYKKLLLNARARYQLIYFKFKGRTVNLNTTPKLQETQLEERSFGSCLEVGWMAEVPLRSQNCREYWPIAGQKPQVLMSELSSSLRSRSRVFIARLVSHNFALIPRQLIKILALLRSTFPIC